MASAVNGWAPLTYNGTNDLSVTDEATYPGTAVEGFGGSSSITVQVAATIGSAGTAINVYIQTSLDQGTSWIDIMAFNFTNTTKTVVATVDARKSITTPYAPTNGSLTPDTVKEGVLGDRLRFVAKSTGVYSNTTVAIRAQGHP